MQKWRQSETADGEEWQLALEREAVIRPLASKSKLSVTLIEEATRQLRLSRTVFYDLLRRYKQRPQTSSLLPWKRGREFKATFLDRPREELLNSCIQEFYLRMERPSLAALVREVRLRFSLRGLPAPHYRTIRGRIGELDLKVSLQKREGAKKAREQVGRVSVSSLRPENPMELIQIDHTPVDVIVVDQEQRLPIGRPWLTLAIDVATQMVAGFHISLWAPSTVSLCLALSHAVLPKDSWLADRELQSLEWPAGGLPRSIHVDNAREFHSDVLVRGCQEYGIQLDHRLVGRPHFGGHIERLIGTMMGAVHLLPGTTFSNVNQKGAYESEKRALLTRSWPVAVRARFDHARTHHERNKLRWRTDPLSAHLPAVRDLSAARQLRQTGLFAGGAAKSMPSGGDMTGIGNCRGVQNQTGLSENGRGRSNRFSMGA
jgi:putative transposase